jgi:hypothetical protein
MPQSSPTTQSLVPISYEITDVTDTPDIPVDLKGFEWNVAKCKACVGLSSFLGVLSEVFLETGANQRLSAWGYATLCLQVSDPSIRKPP